MNETDPPPQLSALVTTMSQEAIGNGKSLLTYGVVPSVFPNQKWEISRPFGIPHEFDFFIPEQSYTFTEAGVAGPITPPLPPGVTSESDEQIDVYRHRLKTGTQNLFGAGVLPITITGSSHDQRQTGRAHRENFAAQFGYSHAADGGLGRYVAELRATERRLRNTTSWTPSLPRRSSTRK